MKLRFITLSLSGIIIIVTLNEAEIKSTVRIEPHTEVETVNVYPRPHLEYQVAGTTSTRISGDPVILSESTLRWNYA